MDLEQRELDEQAGDNPSQPGVWPFVQSSQALPEAEKYARQRRSNLKESSRSLRAQIISELTIHEREYAQKRSNIIKSMNDNEARLTDLKIRLRILQEEIKKNQEAEKTRTKGTDGASGGANEAGRQDKKDEREASASEEPYFGWGDFFYPPQGSSTFFHSKEGSSQPSTQRL